MVVQGSQDRSACQCPRPRCPAGSGDWPCPSLDTVSLLWTSNSEHLWWPAWRQRPGCWQRCSPIGRDGDCSEVAVSSKQSSTHQGSHLCFLWQQHGQVRASESSPGRLLWHRARRSTVAQFPEASLCLGTSATWLAWSCGQFQHVVELAWPRRGVLTSSQSPHGHQVTQGSSDQVQDHQKGVFVCPEAIVNVKNHQRSVWHWSGATHSKELVGCH